LHTTSFLRIKIAATATNINGIQMAKFVWKKAIFMWQIMGARAAVKEAPKE
jgi:hypothetical protein